MCPAMSYLAPGKTRVANQIVRREDGAYEMELTQGLWTVFDADDATLEVICAFKWCTSVVGTNRYAVTQAIDSRTGKRKPLMLHVLLASANDGRDVDHKDDDGLNNRMSNLRLLSRGDNVRRSRKTKTRNSSQYRGVCKTPAGTFAAQIQAYGHRRHLGTFKTEHEAALAWNKAASELFPAELAVNLNNVSEGVSA